MDKLNKNHVKENILKILFVLFILYLFEFLMESFYVVANSYILDFKYKLQIFNLFIIALLFLLFLGITGKSKWSYIIIAIFSFVLLIVNQIKIIYTDEPIYLSDILFLNNTGELVDIVNNSFFSVIKPYIIPTLMFGVLFALTCWLSCYQKFTIKNIKVRLGLIFSVLVVFYFLFTPKKNMTNFILNSVFDTNKRKDYERCMERKAEFVSYGIIGGIYEGFLENRLYEPMDYNEQMVIEEIENNNYIQEDNSFGKPNIIVVFAESFWNVDNLDDVQFNTKIAPNFEELKEKGILFNMISPSYGGVSSNVEYEFLTGCSMRYLPIGYIPTMRLYNNNAYYNAPSIIKELNNNGYKTKIVNYTPGTSFNIEKFYKYIGVKEKIFNTSIERKNFKGDCVSDEYVINQVINEFNNKEKDEKLFYMCLSMQSHMPYLIEKYDKYDISIENSNYSDEFNEVLLSYAQGIYDMDKQLGKLYDYIQTLDEPTMIVFYGDHLPYLKSTSEKNLLDYLEYFNTDNDLINVYRKYNTQSLILANFEIEENEYKYLSPDLLGCYVINKMDINISPYYKWLNKYLTLLPASNWYVTLDKDGNLYNTKELTGELKENYLTREKVQYKYFVDNN